MAPIQYVPGLSPTHGSAIGFGGLGLLVGDEGSGLGLELKLGLELGLGLWLGLRF